MSSTPPVKDTYACDANGCQVIEETSILMEGAVTAGPLENDAGKPSRYDEKQDQREGSVGSSVMNPPSDCVPGASLQGDLSTDQSVSQFVKQDKVKQESAAVVFLGVILILFSASIFYTVTYVPCLASTVGVFCYWDVLFPSVVCAVTLLGCFEVKYNSCLKISTHSYTCIALVVLATIAFVCVNMLSPSTVNSLTVTVMCTFVFVVVLANIGKTQTVVVLLNTKKWGDFFLGIIFATVCIVDYVFLPSFTSFLVYLLVKIFSVFIVYCILGLYSFIALFLVKAMNYMHFVRYDKNVNVRNLFDDVVSSSFKFVVLLAFVAQAVVFHTAKFIPGYIVNAAIHPVAISAIYFLGSPSASLNLQVADSCEEQSPSVQQIDESCSVVRKRVERGLERYSSERHAVGDGEKAQEQQIKPDEAPQYVNNIQGDGNKVVVIPPEYQGPLTVNIIAPK